jgi:hypothetical protein
LFGELESAALARVAVRDLSLDWFPFASSHGRIIDHPLHEFSLSRIFVAVRRAVRDRFSPEMETAPSPSMSGDIDHK